MGQVQTAGSTCAQQQRLAIARALSQEPSLLLLDELSIAVDSPPCAAAG